MDNEFLDQLIRVYDGASTGNFDISEQIIEDFLSFLQITEVKPDEMEFILACFLLSHPESYIMSCVTVTPENLLRIYGFKLSDGIRTNGYTRNKTKAANRLFDIIKERNLADGINEGILNSFICKYELNKVIPPPKIITKRDHLINLIGAVNGTFGQSEKIANDFIDYLENVGEALTIEDLRCILSCYCINKFDFPREKGIIDDRMTRGFFEENGAWIPSGIDNQLRVNKGNHANRFYDFLKRENYIEYLLHDQLDMQLLRTFKIYFKIDEFEQFDNFR